MKSRLTPLALACSILAAPTSELAAQSDDLLEEVVVTARKKSETLFEVPIAVSVLGDVFFEKTGFNTLDTVVKFVPGFDYSPTNTTRAQGTQIRGISTFSFSDGFESSVSTVIDGVVMGREAQGFFDLYDIESLEVIKGPQGTLFGKNASAGVVNIITKKPEYEFSGGGDISYGTFDELRVRGTVTGPLVEDKLAYRLTFSSHDYDGRVDNNLAGEDDVNDKDTWSLRGKLLWEPTDRLSALLTFDTVEENNACCLPTYRLAGDPSFLFDFALNPGVLQLQDALDQFGITADENNRDVAVFYDRINQESEANGVSLTIDYDLGWSTFTSITAWRDWEIDEFNEADQLSFSNVNNRNGTESDSEQVSQEFRLFGDINDRISYVAGLYYFDQDLGADGTVFVEIALPFPPFFNVATNARRTVETTSLAAFSEFTFDVTDKFSLILGGRFTDEEIEATYVRSARPLIEGFPFASNFGPDVAGAQKEDDTDFSGRVIGRYTFNDNISSYLTWSRGYKGVGIDVAESVNIAAIANAGGLPVLKPERPTLVELGLKGRFFDNQLSINSAFFTQKVENLQTISSDSEGQVLNLSIEEVETKGIEIDATYRPAGLEGLTLLGTLTYLDTEYKDFPERPDLVGEPLSNVPEWQTSLIANYDFGLGASGYDAFARAEWSWQDDKNTAIGGGDFNDIDDYSLLNLRAGVTSPSGRYSATLSVENVTDENYPFAVFGTSYAAVDGMTRAQFLGPPRLYRLTVGVDF